MVNCSICEDPLEPEEEEEGIYRNCQSSIVSNDNFDLV